MSKLSGTESAADRHVPDRGVTLWLFAIAALVLAMVVLGGLTRLTGSGLSMVEWKVIMGAVPPLTHEQWVDTFEAYKQFPEYQKVNKGMSLEEFKFIFFMEYFHRLLGRLVGVVFLIWYLWFWARGRLTGGEKKRYIVLFILGGLQGLVGWYMVKSGLVSDPRVSQYRLVMHLGLALVIYGLALWFAFSRLPAARAEQLRLPLSLRRTAWLVAGLTALQILSGGFVAGLHAGHSYNTWPTMLGAWIPSTLFAIEPAILNLTENPVMVQFIHRNLAYTLCLAVAALYLLCHKHIKTGPYRRAAQVVLVLMLLQMTLGILTLLHAVPVALGSLHQLGAVSLLTAVLFLLHGTVGKNS